MQLTKLGLSPILVAGRLTACIYNAFVDFISKYKYSVNNLIRCSDISFVLNEEYYNLLTLLSVLRTTTLNMNQWLRTLNTTLLTHTNQFQQFINVNVTFARVTLRTSGQLAKLPATRRSSTTRKHRLTLEYMEPIGKEQRKRIVSKQP